MSERRRRRRSTTRSMAALGLALALASLPATARAEDRDSRGHPLELAGHLLAPVGQLYGWLVVEPILWVTENVPVIFELD